MQYAINKFWKLVRNFNPVDNAHISKLTYMLLENMFSRLDLFIHKYSKFIHKFSLTFGWVILLCSLMLDEYPPGTIISHLNHSSTQNLVRNKPLCNTNTMPMAWGETILTEKSLPFKNTSSMWRKKLINECRSVHYYMCQ